MAMEAFRRRVFGDDWRSTVVTVIEIGKVSVEEGLSMSLREKLKSHS